LASSVTATVLQQRVQLPHVRPGTSARGDADADAPQCDAGWADELAIPAGIALGLGDIKPTPSPDRAGTSKPEGDGLIGICANIALCTKARQ